MTKTIWRLTRTWNDGHKTLGRFSTGAPYWTQRMEEPKRSCNNKPIVEANTIREIAVQLTAKTYRAIAKLGFQILEYDMKEGHI